MIERLHLHPDELEKIATARQLARDFLSGLEEPVTFKTTLNLLRDSFQ